MSTSLVSLKVRYDDQFFRPGSVSASTTALVAAVRRFLSANGVADADEVELDLKFRDAAGAWQPLSLASDDLSPALLDNGSKLTVDVQLVRSTPPTLSASTTTAADSNDNSETTEKSTGDNVETKTETSETEAEPVRLCGRARGCRGRGRKLCGALLLVMFFLLFQSGVFKMCHSSRWTARGGPRVQLVTIPDGVFNGAELQELQALEQIAAVHGAGALAEPQRARLRQFHEAIQSRPTIAAAYDELHQHYAASQNHVNQLAARVQHDDAKLHAAAEVLQATRTRVHQLELEAQQLHQHLTAAAQRHQQLEQQLAVALRQQQPQPQQQQQQHQQPVENKLESFTQLVLDASKKAGNVAAVHIDELARKHFGKPIDEIFDGTRVADGLTNIVKNLHKALDELHQRQLDKRNEAKQREHQQREQQQLVQQQEREREHRRQQQEAQIQHERLQRLAAQQVERARAEMREALNKHRDAASPRKRHHDDDDDDGKQQQEKQSQQRNKHHRRSWWSNRVEAEL